MPRPSAIVVHSGGLDSTVLLYKCREDFNVVLSLGFDYGQRHVRELFAASEICHHLDIERSVVELKDLKHLIHSSQTGHMPVPEGHYTAENMKQTVVPNRNMIMLSIAAGIAISMQAPIVAYGPHAGDHAIYPDCRPEFVDKMDEVLMTADEFAVKIFAPFLDMTKTDIVRLGAELNVPFELTRTCYNDRVLACGRCGTCVERLEAFAIAGLEDPLEYEDREFWRSATRTN